jgi:PAS domain-containing protein
LISGYDINGKVTGSIGIHLDITEQKEQEEKLYLLFLNFRENINAVVISDVEGRIEWVNASFEKMSGYTRELIGVKPGSLLQGKLRSGNRCVLKNQIRKGNPLIVKL